MPQQKPTILFVITQGGPWGGAQKYVADLAEAVENEFVPVVAVGEPAGIPDLQNRLKQNPEIDVIQLKHLRRDISPLHDFLAILELRRLIKKIKPAIVHLNSTKAGILGSLATYTLNAKRFTLIYTVHGWVFNEPMGSLKRLLYRLLERSTAKTKAKIIVLSKEEADTGKRLGVPAHKLMTIPPGIEQRPEILSRHDARAALRQRLGHDVPMDAFWIGTIANHYPTKGLDVLLRAIAESRHALHGAHLVLIGDGPVHENLKSQISNLKISECVHLTGFLPNAARYLPAFDLFVLPSRKEGLPYTLIEAKLHGIPIIATDVGGISSLIEDNKTGTLVPAENILALSSALQHALEHPDEMRRMADAGMADGSATTYSKKRMVEDTTALYRSLQVEG